jgi:ubiquinone biosynthesis protein COQ9
MPLNYSVAARIAYRKPTSAVLHSISSALRFPLARSVSCSLRSKSIDGESCQNYAKD